jgi:twitching motility protein PilI
MVSKHDLLTTNSSGQEPFSTVLQELESREGELHLRFYVASNQEFALPAIGIRELMSIPLDRITPIPNASPLLMGTLNLRGRVIWVADLGQFLGKQTALNIERAEISVIAVEDQDTMVGLAVDKIVGMEWLDVEKVQMLTNVPDSAAPFLRGEWLLDKQTHQRLQLLDPKEILRSERWVA